MAAGTLLCCVCCLTGTRCWWCCCAYTRWSLSCRDIFIALHGAFCTLYTALSQYAVTYWTLNSWYGMHAACQQNARCAYSMIILCFCEHLHATQACQLRRCKSRFAASSYHLNITGLICTRVFTCISGWLRPATCTAEQSPTYLAYVECHDEGLAFFVSLRMPCVCFQPAVKTSKAVHWAADWDDQKRSATVSARMCQAVLTEGAMHTMLCGIKCACVWHGLAQQ